MATQSTVHLECHKPAVYASDIIFFSKSSIYGIGSLSRISAESWHLVAHQNISWLLLPLRLCNIALNQDIPGTLEPICQLWFSRRMHPLHSLWLQLPLSHIWRWQSLLGELFLTPDTTLYLFPPCLSSSITPLSSSSYETKTSLYMGKYQQIWLYVQSGEECCLH